MYSGTEVQMDEAKQDQVGGAGLYTLGLACCIGISVCGTYAQEAEPGEIRYDAFLAHLADGPLMEKTWQSLKRNVDLAKSNGLTNLKIQVCIVDPSTLKEDNGMKWSQALIAEQQKINDDYIIKATSLLTTGSQKVDVHSHHINKEVDMRITSDRRMLILDA
ncbi:hypothetical protein INS49_009526 [Diaporthe citri]|uniref:uncharacterized protein n=1 Tax=Diaporthe citri TaxID=83186 RepID=UPI001C7F8710|nr:uncharacterized protein INS49_009526 [Diaporthe citri]KAG6361301.1 hypothetical protein INS49_009526 [Diaporthe citri]